VVPTSAQRGEGPAELLAAIDAHRAALLASGEIALRRTQINERRLLKASEEILRDAFLRHRSGHVSQLLAQLDERTLSPHAGAKRLLEAIRNGENP
jgi:putative protein kinase ArgK-like GTPase of G3E family